MGGGASSKVRRDRSAVPAAARVIRFIYNLLFPIGLLLFLPRALVKMACRGNYGHKFGQRLGIYDAATRQRLRAHPRTWIHAVSVGEVAVALKLIAELREQEPAFHAVLTTTTSTGFAFASTRAAEWLEVMYNPLDWWPITRRAFAAISPVRIVLVEAEVWPNLVAIASARGVPIALVNARLSSRSEARFRRFVRFVRPTFSLLDLVCVQEAADVHRWAQLGVRPNRIRHVGSVKFDHTAEPPAQLPENLLRESGFNLGMPVLFGGSTHEGEEALLAKVWSEVRSEIPHLRLVIAPRHVERADSIAALLVSRRLRVVRRTNLPAVDDFDCLLLDTTGELQQWYSIATVVFIGKSITARGGQNPVEPIVAGKPVIFGPHMENFQPLARTLLRNDGAVQVHDAATLADAARNLLRDARSCLRLVANARKVLENHRGATVRTANLLVKLTTTGKRLATRGAASDIARFH
jgi:3-deoxy-D-manno-octulosonic-acid transferase